MQISKRQLKPKFEEELKIKLAQVISDIPTQTQAMLFLQDFLTETEFLAMAKRLAIIDYLQNGASYESIKKEVMVSSATIASMQKLMDQKSLGLQLALRLMKAEAWAHKWASKLTTMFSKQPQAESV